MIAYRKEYYQRPEVIARGKAWRSSPEGKESLRRGAAEGTYAKKNIKEQKGDPNS